MGMTLVERSGARALEVPAGRVRLNAVADIPPGTDTAVLFVHGSDISRYRAQNRYIAAMLKRQGIGTVLVNLMTPEEEIVDIYANHLRFNVEVLARRLGRITEWLTCRREFDGVRLGFFGTNTFAAAALVAASRRPGDIAAVVARAGRTDLADHVLPRLKAPTLFIAGTADYGIIDLNRSAMKVMKAPNELLTIPGADRYFEKQIAMRKVANAALGWFKRYVPADAAVRRE